MRSEMKGSHEPLGDELKRHGVYLPGMSVLMQQHIVLNEHPFRRKAATAEVDKCQ